MNTKLKDPSSFEAEATALNEIANALLDPEGPGNLTEAVFLCANNLADIAKTLAEIQKTLVRLSLKVLPGDQ
jgi:hypothetical protein